MTASNVEQEAGPRGTANGRVYRDGELLREELSPEDLGDWL